MKRRKEYSIQQAITLSFSVLTLSIVSAALIIAYRFTIEEVQNVSTDYISQLISQVNDNVDQYVTYIEDVSEVVRKNSSVRKWAAEVDSAGPATTMVLADSVINQLTGIVNVRSDVSTIAAFTPSGSAVFDSREKSLNVHARYEETDWYTEAVKRGGDCFVSSSHVQNVVANRYDWVVSVSRAITKGSGEIMGVLLVDLNYSLINDLCAGVDMGMQGYLYVVDKEGNIIYHPQQQLVYSHVKSEVVDDVLGKNTQIVKSDGNSSKLYISNYSEVTGWTVLGVVNADGLIQSSNNIFTFYALFVLLFLAAGAFLSAVICQNLTDPLQKLVIAMEEVKSDNLELRSNILGNISGPREATQLSSAFNEMIAQLNQSIRQQEKAREERREIEFKALQAQINPHFLYNTLDSIIWMAENGDSDGVVEMTAALARLFRSSISEDRELVPFSVEVANIRSYLTILQMRYKEKLSYDIDIPSGLLLCSVPKLLLQPLVENAIYHGIKPKDGPGKITIKGFEDKGRLIIEISDNGVGMSKDQLSNILNKKPHSGGIGISNVHNRIRLIFGEEYGLSYAGALDAGTIVRVTLPLAI